MSKELQNMTKQSVSKVVMPLICGIFSVICANFAYGDEDIGPMAGAGGVMRDAERRVMTSVERPAEEEPEAAVKEPEAAVPDDDPRMKRLRQRVLGPVSNIEILGSVEFAEREGVVVSLLDELGDGRTKTLADVTIALMKVRQDLIHRGFYLARIILPPGSEVYTAETATLTLRVDEGRFGTMDVKFENDAEDGRWFSRRQILRRFRNVREGESFDYSKLRSALSDVNSQPDLKLDTSIAVRRPRPEEGEGRHKRSVDYADMVMDVRESFPFHMVWEINNYGMEEVEEWQTSLTAQYLNLTKHDDVLTISPAMSFGGELMSLAGSYMIPHEWWLGGNTTLYGGYSHLDVDDVVPRLDLEGSGWFVGLQHSENIIDTQEHQLAIAFGALWRYIEDQYTALGYKLDKRGTAILPVSVALSYTGKKADGLGGRNFATVQALYNVMNSGDDVDEMWTDADDKYWLLRWQLARLQPLFGIYSADTEQYLHQWILFLKLEGQYTTDNLLPVEKLSLGGYNCLRGYHTRGYLGDKGIYGTTELRTPILVDAITSIFGSASGKPVDRLQFLGFCDYGYVAYNDLPSGYDDDEYLCSMGVGARMACTKYSQLRCDLAFPLVNGNNDEDDDYELYLSFQLQF